MISERRHAAQTASGPYESPMAESIEIIAEGVLCASDQLWYHRNGSGDFTYEYEDDTMWQ